MTVKRLKRIKPALAGPVSRLQVAKDAQQKAPLDQPYLIRKRRAVGEVKLYYRPSSETTDLVLELSDALDRFHLGESFLGFVPSRVGQSRAIASAARAVIDAQKFAVSGNISMQTLALQNSNVAMTALRNDLAKGHGQALQDAMLAAALLYCCESTINPTVATSSPHNKGLSSILLTLRKTPCKDDELARCLFYFHWKGTFNLPVALGQPSPFDNQYWLSQGPAHIGTPGREIERLRWLGQKLLIQLPRLIALVRSVRRGTQEYEAVELAEDLARTKDDEAEDAVLHSLKVVKTVLQDREDAAIVPVSYYFKDTAQFEGALYYWQTRILANRLLVTLLELRSAKNSPGRVQSLKDENVRMVMNMMMAFQYALSIGLVGCWAYCLGWIIVWGAVQDVDCVRRGSRTLSSSLLRPWMLRKYSDLHGGHTAYRETDMDDAALMLVGGPLGPVRITGMM